MTSTFNTANHWNQHFIFMKTNELQHDPVCLFSLFILWKTAQKQRAIQFHLMPCLFTITKLQIQLITKTTS